MPGPAAMELSEAALWWQLRDDMDILFIAQRLLRMSFSGSDARFPILQQRSLRLKPEVRGGSDEEFRNLVREADNCIRT